MSAGGLRLFVAIELPKDVRETAAAAVAHALEDYSDWRRTHKDELHVTLAFLGASVDPELLDPLQERLGAAAAESTGISTGLTELGRFPDRGRAKIAWIGLDDPDGALGALAASVAAAVGDLVTLEERPFRAHLTVARAKRPSRLPAEFLGMRVEARSFEVDHLTLFRSTPSAAPGSRYEALARWPLGPLAP